MGIVESQANLLQVVHAFHALGRLLGLFGRFANQVQNRLRVFHFHQQTIIFNLKALLHFVHNLANQLHNVASVRLLRKHFRCQIKAFLCEIHCLGRSLAIRLLDK